MSAILRLALAVAASVATMAGTGGAGLSDDRVSSDEEVLILPTVASLSAKGDTWTVRAHVWIFEPEEDSRLRVELAKAFASALGLPVEEAMASPIFRERVRLFVADNESGKRLVFGAGEVERVLPKTGGNGRAAASFELSSAMVEAARRGPLLPVRVPAGGGDSREFRGEVYLADPQGFAVISDIDDTIKVSQVTDREKLLANTFLKPFVAVEGMAELYASWAGEGASFHYVSMSPWQLGPALQSWLATAGFPGGELALRNVRIADGSVLSLFDDAEEAKPPMIRRILGEHPGRRVVLVGDSSERDPEIYAALAQSEGERIAHIAIRNTTNQPSDDPRWARAFAGLPRDRWTVFESAKEIAAQSKVWAPRHPPAPVGVSGSPAPGS
jgi:phosphatidate phosphatase APP1